MTRQAVGAGIVCGDQTAGDITARMEVLTLRRCIIGLVTFLMAFSSVKLAAITVSLAIGGSALALGLGNVSGQPVLGQTLLLEIPLLGIDEGVPALECFRIRAPSAEIESGFVLRNAQIQIQTERNQARLVLTSSSAVREPVIEFSLAVGCGFGLSKDYLLLTAEPSKIALPLQPTRPTILPPPEPPAVKTDAVRPQKAESLAVSSTTTLRLVADVTLEKLARQRYPLQPKAREKFIRMMRQANPELVQIDELIVGGSELQIPPGLPVRREPTSKTESKSAPATRPEKVSRTPAPATASKPTKPTRDMLVLGHPGQKNAAELLSEAERLTTLLVEQTNAQAAADDKLTQLEGSFKILQKHAIALENRIHAIEAERQAEKLAPKPASFDFFELLLAILAGGAIGGLSLYFYDRVQSRRESQLNKSGEDVFNTGNRRGSELPTEPLNLQNSDGLPWQKRNQVSRPSIAGEASGKQLLNTEKPQQPLKPPEAAPSSSTPQNDFDFVSKP
ncbi:MAG: hypothetical protein WC100_07960 [Sterolibacterium sp.]